MIPEINKLKALEVIRESTLLKQAAAPAIMMNNPGQQLNKNQYIGNNDQETGRSILQGGSNSRNFQALQQTNQNNTADGSQVNALNKLFKPASGTLKNVNQVANNQAKQNSGMVGGNLNPPQKNVLASVNPMIAIRRDLEKVAALPPWMRAAGSALTKPRRLPKWFQFKGKPTAAPSRGAREPQYRISDIIDPSTGSGARIPIGPPPGPVGKGFPHMSLEPGADLSFGQKARNLFTPKGMKQYFVGAGPKDTHLWSGRPVQSIVGPRAEGLAGTRGTYSAGKDGERIWHGMPADFGDALSMGMGRAPTLSQRYRGARLAQQKQPGRVFSKWNPFTVGRDITKADAGKTLPWGQRSQRLGGLGRALPSGKSAVGRTAKMFGGATAFGAGQTVWNPFYDVGVSQFPGDFQIRDAPKRETMSAGTRLRHAVGTGLQWAPYGTGLGTVADLTARHGFDIKDPLGGDKMVMDAERKWTGGPLAMGEPSTDSLYEYGFGQQGRHEAADRKAKQRAAKETRTISKQHLQQAANRNKAILKDQREKRQVKQESSDALGLKGPMVGTR